MKNMINVKMEETYLEGILKENNLPVSEKNFANLELFLVNQLKNYINTNLKKDLEEKKDRFENERWMWDLVQDDLEILEEKLKAYGDISKEKCYDIWSSISDSCSCNWLPIDETSLARAQELVEEQDRPF